MHLNLYHVQAEIFVRPPFTYTDQPGLISEVLNTALAIVSFKFCIISCASLIVKL